MSQIVDNLIAYRVLSMLVKPFVETEAFKLGIIDAQGKNLIKPKDFTTQAQKNAYNYLTRLVFNMKKLINMLPGGDSKLKNIVAAFFLIKESYSKRSVTVSQSDLIKLVEMLDNGVVLVEEQLIVEDFMMLNEDAPANMTGAGVSTDQPVIRKRKPHRFAKFVVNDEVFRRFSNGKPKFKKWSNYLNLEDEGQEQIYKFAKKNPKKDIVLQNGTQTKSIRFNNREDKSWSKFKEYLTEYLTPKQRSKYSKIKMSDEARSGTDHFFGKDNDETREDLIGHTPDKSEVHTQIEKHLGKEIHVDDYKKGLTKDNHGRDVKIGRLVKDENLRNQFANDSTRQGSKSSKSHYVTVVRGTEVAGQTNSAPDATHPKGHSWGDQSCKNVDDGSNKKYLKHEITHGSCVVRVHDHAGQEIYRATLHPHHNDKNHVAYAVDSEYGVKQSTFTNHAHNVAERLSGEHKGGSLLYTKHDKVYNDSGKNTLLHPSATATKEGITTLLNNENPKIRRLAINHPKATAEHISKALDDKDEEVRRLAIKHPKATAEHISKALKDENQYVREYAISHPNATAEHINKALDDKSSEVRERAIKHPNATAEHINKALDDEDHFVRRSAISSPNATAEHISKALEDQSQYVRQGAIECPNATAEHISKALDDKEGGVRIVAASHPNATAEHISKALEDQSQYVRRSAINHRNATAEHISKALDDESNEIRNVAIKHPNAIAKHISKALNDKSSEVRTRAIEHPNATAEHISKALKDENQYIRNTAEELHSKKIQSSPKPNTEPNPKRFKNYIKFH